MAIRIITGWSNPGGSTVAHINLVNAFNERGIDASLYGPHDWHLDKCKSGKISEVPLDNTDIVITHYLTVTGPLPRKLILSCHETNLFPLKNLDLSYYDFVHFVSKSQENWHGLTNIPSSVIPNVLSDLKYHPKSVYETAGIIGSIDGHKNTGLSIRRAVADGYKNILVYGSLNDQNHFMLDVKEWVDKGYVKLMGHCDDKQAMYDSVNVVYHSSLRETFNYVKAECELTGTEYNGLPNSESGAEYWSKDKIVDKWIEVLEL